MVKFNQVVMLGKEKTMKRKFISILLAAMICFSLTASVTAYNAAEEISDEPITTTNSSCLHTYSWEYAGWKACSGCIFNCLPCRMNIYDYKCSKCKHIDDSTTLHTGTPHNWFSIPNGGGSWCRLCNAYKPPA